MRALASKLSQLPEEKSLREIDYSIERRQMRWILPCAAVIGLALMYLAKPLAASLITLDFDGGLFSRSSNFHPSARTILIALLPLSLAVIWIVLSRFEETYRHPNRLHLLAPALAFVLVWFLGSAHKQWIVQVYFLEAIKVRAEPASLERSVAYWKKRVLGPQTESRKTISLIGSSQMNLSIDEELLAELIPETRIVKNALPGFGILQYVTALPILAIQDPQKVICLVSEFDTFRDEHVPASRLRYFVGMAQLIKLGALMDWSLLIKNRSQMTDLLASALSPMWRDRDLFRVLWLNSWWKASPVRAAPSSDYERTTAIRAHSKALAESIGRTNLVDLNFAAFEAFARQLAAEAVELWVFEGMTNPLAMSQYDPDGELRRESRERFAKMADRVGFIFVTEQDMPAFGYDDFADAVHLGPQARERFTNFMGVKICGDQCDGRTVVRISHDE